MIYIEATAFPGMQQQQQVKKAATAAVAAAAAGCWQQRQQQRRRHREVRRGDRPTETNHFRSTTVCPHVRCPVDGRWPPARRACRSSARRSIRSASPVFVSCRVALTVIDTHQRQKSKTKQNTNINKNTNKIKQQNKKTGQGKSITAFVCLLCHNGWATRIQPSVRALEYTPPNNQRSKKKWQTGYEEPCRSI